MQKQLNTQAKAKIADDDARAVYLCIARYSGGNGAPKQMTVREIAKTARLLYGRVVECVRGCEFLSFLDNEDDPSGPAGDRVVQIHRLPASVPEASAALEWVRKILRKDYGVEFVGYVESAKTPGFLGAYGGVTDHEARQVRIATFDKSDEQIIEALAHEFDHVCGKKVGRPGKQTVCGGQRGVL